MASRPVTVNDLLDGHVGLDVECLDRIEPPWISRSVLI